LNNIIDQFKKVFMEESVYAGHARRGTVGGMLLIFLTNITSGDLVRTVVLAATGAAVSFMVSFVMKWVMERWRR
jgi:hypothetical protein